MLTRLAAQYLMEIRELVVVGHSMGGDIATLLCASSEFPTVRALVNIEGTLTRDDLFISNQAVQAQERGAFAEWFHDFKAEQVYETLGSKYSSCRRYFASLCFARPDAFLKDSMETLRTATARQGCSHTMIAEVYMSLSIPHVFCYGGLSASGSTVALLQRQGLDSMSYANAFHWVMIDAADVLYRDLASWIDHTVNTQ